MYRKLFVCFLVLVFVGTGVSIVQAAPPDHYLFQFDDTHHAPRFSRYCGFPVTVREWGTIDDIVFHDTAGNYVGENFVLTQGGVAITNELTGKTFSSMTSQLIKYGLDSASVSGLTAHVFIPGKGQIMLDAGRVTIDLVTGERVFEAGVHDYMDGNWQAVCDQLAIP